MGNRWTLMVTVKSAACWPCVIPHCRFSALPALVCSDTSKIRSLSSPLKVQPFGSMDSSVTAVTDASGRFGFDRRAKKLPEFFVHINGGMTATTAPSGYQYPSVGKPFHSVAGEVVQINHHGETFDIFLPPMAISDVQPLSETEATRWASAPTDCLG
ncbi:MAG: hypothetical protein R3C05_05315 [Pirellulaceae bacterium]